MPFEQTHKEGRAPKEPHLALITGRDGSAIAIPAGATLVAIRPPGTDGAKDVGYAKPILLLSMKVKAARLEILGRCCSNPECTQTIKLEGTWIGRHQDSTKRD